jgi:hypothetical protein
MRAIKAPLGPYFQFPMAPDPFKYNLLIRWRERGMAASVDWSLNVLAATQSDATLGEQLLSFARKFVINR